MIKLCCFVVVLWSFFVSASDKCSLVFDTQTGKINTRLTRGQFNILSPPDKQLVQTHFKDLNDIELQRAIALRLSSIEIAGFLTPEQQRRFANDFNWSEIRKLGAETFANVFEGLSVENIRRLNKERIESAHSATLELLARDITEDQFKQLTNDKVIIHIFNSIRTPERQRQFAFHLSARIIEFFLTSDQRRRFANIFRWSEIRKLGANAFASVFEGLSIENIRRLNKDRIENATPETLKLLARDITEDQFMQLTDHKDATQIFNHIRLPEKQKKFASYLSATEIEMYLTPAQRREFANAFKWSEIRRLGANAFANVFEGLSLENRQKLDKKRIESATPETLELLARDITEDQIKQLTDRDTIMRILKAVSPRRQNMLLHLLIEERVESVY